MNFCHPASTFYIPFKIICIIGFNRQNYLKRNILDSFNLLNKYQFIGDINFDEQNSYLFLQAISSTQEHLYISYIDSPIEDKHKQYPSELLDQLFNYITYNFCFIGNESLNTRDNAKKIFKYFYKKHEQMIFYQEIDKNNIAINDNQKSFKKQNIQRYKKNLYIEKTLKKSFSNKISLTNLIKFWKNPIRYFFNFKLNIKFHQKKQDIITTEPFLINNLDRFKINTTFLNNIIYNKDIQTLFNRYLISGVLPYGFFGIIFLKKQIKEMQSIAKLVAYYRDLRKAKKFNLIINKHQLYGELNEIQNTGLLRWTSGKINYGDRISLWLEHLIYSALGEMGESKIIGYKKKIWTFSPLNPDIAYNYLLQYIRGYIYGIKKPLLLTRSGACWIDNIYDIKNNCVKHDNNSKKKGYKIFLKNWLGNNFYQGEKEDFYIKKIIIELNKKNTKKIHAIAKKWLLPILKNKKHKELVK